MARVLESMEIPSAAAPCLNLCRKVAHGKKAFSIRSRTAVMTDFTPRPVQWWTPQVMFLAQLFAVAREIAAPGMTVERIADVLMAATSAEGQPAQSAHQHHLQDAHGQTFQIRSGCSARP